MPFDFGDIVLVPFPFTNQSASKKRPAVVVSSRAYNTSRPDVILMAITSQLRPTGGIGEVWLQDWKGAGLLKPSAVKSVVTTIEQQLVIKQLGTLTQVDRASVKKAIALIFD